MRRDGPEALGALRGREGWLASHNARMARLYARNAAASVSVSLDQEARARDAAVCRYTEEVERQRAGDAVEVPGLSNAALVVLNDMQVALQATELPRDGERY